jgi:LmbE family N-acetylglucosaminyl deacetylase
MKSSPLLWPKGARKKGIIFRSLIEKYEPEMIFTHHYGDLNCDHRITFEAVLTAELEALLHYDVEMHLYPQKSQAKRFPKKKDSNDNIHRLSLLWNI